MAYPEAIQELLKRIARDGGATPTLIETHISWVVLAGPYAYKIKKPVKFAFVDFTSLDKREHCCREELRLNRRLAPEIYLDVIPIIRDDASEATRFGNAADIHQITGGEKSAAIIDWAVKMRAFDAEATLDQATVITETQIDAIIDVIAAFHAREPGIAAESPLASAPEIAKIVLANLQELKEMLPGNSAVARLEAWTQHELVGFADFFNERKATGMIRDCHGDLHLGNIAWVNGKPLIFDCVEFSETLRCIDVINEVAFLFMDLCARGHTPLAWRMINRYLEITGDYAGLKILRLYSVYRALVRAKISLHQKKRDDCERYLALAESLSAHKPPQMLLMHGYSGSGKTYWSQKILQERGMVRLRSDVERQRLFAQENRYSPRATEATFDRLRDLAQTLLQTGFSVIIDATFLKQPLRAMFTELADRLHVPVHIVDVAATPDECRARIRRRIVQGGDASEADLEVLEHQLATADPLTGAETQLALSPKSYFAAPSSSARARCNESSL